MLPEPLTGDMMRRAIHLCLAAAIALVVNTAAFAAPQITSMSVRGLQIGATTQITLAGNELLPEPKLLIGIPIAGQVVLENSTAGRLRMQVTLGDDVTPGLYNLRLANTNGISENIIIAVDKLPQSPLAEQTKSLPVALHATLAGSNIARTSFAGKAGQKLIVEVESRRLGGKLRPVLHLYDARKRQLALATPAPWLAGDARLVATIPSDGRYTVELHDLQYAAGNPGHYRLKIGEFRYADLVFPPVVERGKATPLELIGNVPDTATVEFSAKGNLPVAAPWPQLPMASGWRPRVLISDLPELLEMPSKVPQPLPSIPVAVSGRLDAAGQEDVYRLPVSPGMKLRLEVFADRLGSPIDAVLEIRTDKGRRLAQNDDADGTADPRIDYTVAKGVSTIDLAIGDQVDCGDRRCIYRLVVTPLEEKRSSFRLTVDADTHNVRQGASRVFHVRSHRDGYDGPIRLTPRGVPSSITASAVEIPAGCNGALMTLTGSGAETASAITSILGTSVGIDPPLTATAAFDAHPLAKTQPWMQHDLALALTPANQVSFQIAWDKPASETPLTLGTTFKAPVRLSRPADAIGPVRLSLLVSQPVPVVNNRPDANRAVRAQQATVEIPIDAKAKAAFDALTAAEKQLAGATTAADKARAALEAATSGQSGDEATRKAAVEAAEKTNAAAQTAAKDAAVKRAEAEANLRTAEANIKKEAEFNVIVPPNLDIATCDLAIRAELRSLDNRSVLAEVFTAVRRLTPLNPLGLELASGSKLETRLDPKNGAVVRLSGTIQRKAGFAGDVTVSITGQPGGVAASRVVLKPDKNDYQIELKFPANFKPAEVRSIKLFASGPPNPRQANIVVRTEMPISINILPAEPAEKKE